jgi:hypothetical protein
MVDVDVTASNGTRTLPASVDIAQSEAKMLPSPNALKALRAETGKTYGELLAAGEEAQWQITIWRKLRRTIPDLRYDECGDIEPCIIEDEPPDPTRLPVSASSPPSAVTGG